tara:strand:- start:1419 stop:1928 length:510 start_codon:yes stop_codon:yes gene_type:complete
MALFGTQRDVSLIRSLNRELLGDIITQQCAVYKLNLGETKVNIYGESSGAKYYQDPILLNVLLERGDQTYSSGDMGVDYNRDLEFRFFRQDLVEASLVMEPGDIIMYYESYFEVDNVIDNQLFVGKDPRYPYNTNPLNPGLEDFGSNLSIICKAHYTPADRVQITRERL